MRTIAAHLADVSRTRGWSATDFSLADLWLVGNPRTARWQANVLASAVLAVPWAIYIVFGWKPRTWELRLWLILVSCCFFVIPLMAAFIADRSDWLPQLARRQLATRSGRKKLARALAVGLVYGLIVGLYCTLAASMTVALAHWMTVGLSYMLRAYWLGFALSFGLTAGLAVGLAAPMRYLERPSQFARHSLAHFLATSLAVGLVGELLDGGLPNELAYGLAYGLRSGLPLGLAYGLILGGGIAWLRYAIAIHRAAGTGSLPRRTAAFLDWAYAAGLLRMVGGKVQFRHKDFQDWLCSNRTGSNPTGSNTAGSGPTGS